MKISYVDESGAQSFVYDYNGNVIGVGSMEGERYFVLPYVVDGVYVEQYHDLRTTLLKNFLRKHSAQLIFTNHAGVYAYLYKQNKKKVLIVVNSTEEDLPTTDLELNNLSFTNLYTINRKNGKKCKVKYERDGNIVRIKSENMHLSTQTFIFT